MIKLDDGILIRIYPNGTRIRGALYDNIVIQGDLESLVKILVWLKKNCVKYNACVSYTLTDYTINDSTETILLISTNVRSDDYRKFFNRIKMRAYVMDGIKISGIIKSDGG